MEVALFCFRAEKGYPRAVKKAENAVNINHL
jgi:hypothetical protein